MRVLQREISWYYSIDMLYNKISIGDLVCVKANPPHDQRLRPHEGTLGIVVDLSLWDYRQGNEFLVWINETAWHLSTGHLEVVSERSSGDDISHHIFSEYDDTDPFREQEFYQELF